MEVNDAAQIIQEAADPDANIIFGAVLDDTMEGEIQITAIATGFDGRPQTYTKASGVPASTNQREQLRQQEPFQPQQPQPQQPQPQPRPDYQPRTPAPTADPYDVPSFLRQRNQRP
jgi:cell division protein FtsZ